MKKVLMRIPFIMLGLAIAVGYFVEHALSNEQLRTIADVRTSSGSSGIVAISGTITEAHENRFVMKDGTGTAELYTCPEWYRVIDLQRGDKVVVTGEVVRHASPGCDFILSVFKISHDGDTIVLRDRPGTPPWIRNKPADTSQVSYGY
jgi:uncharacterized protein YdeI (BOF family)